MKTKMMGKLRVRLSICGIFLFGWCASVAAAESKTVRSEPAIEVSQTIPDSIEPGSAYPVEVVVRNVGKVPVSGLIVTADLPKGHEFTNSVPAPARLKGLLSWNLGNLSPGESLPIRLDLKAAADAPAQAPQRINVVYQAQVDAEEPLRVRRPELGLSVQGPEQVQVGAPVAFRVTIANRGSKPTTDVSLRCILGDGLTHPHGKELENPLGTLEAGQSKTITLTVTPTQAGELSAKFRLQTQGSALVEEIGRVTAQQSKLAVSVLGPPTLVRDEPVLYEVVATNPASDAMKNVMVETALPEGVTFVRATDGGTYDSQTHRVRWNLGEMSAKQVRGLVWHGVPRKVGEVELRVVWSAEGNAGGQEAYGLKVQDPSLPR